MATGINSGWPFTIYQGP